MKFALIFVASFPFLFGVQTITQAEPTAVTAEEAIPTTLDEALLALDQILREDAKNDMRTSGRDTSAYHFSLGMGLRNRWRLWQDSPLSLHLRDLGVTHPDAMSSLIIETYIRRLRGQPLDIEKQIEKHKAEWEASRPMRQLIEKRMNDLQKEEK